MSSGQTVNPLLSILPLAILLAIIIPTTWWFSRHGKKKGISEADTLTIGSSKVTSEFYPGNKIAKRTIIALWGIVILSILLIIVTVTQISHISKVNAGLAISQGELLSAGRNQQVLGYLIFAANILSAILFLMWIHRAHKNLSAFKVEGLEYTPGWAVGWFFVPIFSFFRPYQVMREIWKASEPKVNINDGSAWKNVSNYSLVKSWWALFIITHILGIGAMQGGTNAKTVSALSNYEGSLIFDIAFAIVTIFLIKAVNQRQEYKSQSINK